MPGPHGTGWSPAVDQIMEETVALVERYWWTGWEPLTAARADDPTIWVERFGHDPEEGIFFAVYNSAATPASFVLMINGDALGLDPGDPLIVTELISSETVSSDRADDEIRIPGRLGGEETFLYRLSSQ